MTARLDGKPRNHPPVRRGRPARIHEGYNWTTGRWKPDAPVSKFMAAIRVHSTLTDACAFARISWGSYVRYMARSNGLVDDPTTLPEHDRSEFDRADWPYFDFRAELAAAQAEAKLGLLDRLDNASRKGHWRATLAMLERKYPNEWALQRKVEHSGQIETATTLDGVLSTPAVREAVYELAERIAYESDDEVVDAEIVDEAVGS